MSDRYAVLEFESHYARNIFLAELNAREEVTIESYHGTTTFRVRGERP